MEESMEESNTRVIILNGPPLSGKDTLGKIASDSSDEFCLKSFKEPLTKILLDFYEITREQFEALYTREFKEEPSRLLNGKSPRSALIHVSENVIKPSFGKGIFGEMVVHDLERGKINLFTDGGFAEEIVALRRVVGSNNVVVVRIFGEGLSYEGDSRSYFEFDGVTNMVDIKRTDGDPLKTWLDICNEVGRMTDVLSK